MDQEINKGIFDFSRTNGATDEGIKTPTINGTTPQATYDDVIDIQLSEHNQPNPDNYQYEYSVLQENKFCYFKKYCLLYIILTIELLAGVVFFEFHYLFNEALDVSSANKYPLLNPDLCDPVNPYYTSSWFTPSPTVKFDCDVPIQISEINVEYMVIYPGSPYPPCLSKLDCMSLIGHYFQLVNCKYNFFIDHNSNVYQGRGWTCPFKSGQVWIGIIPDDYIPNRDPEEMKRILVHFNTEIVSYAEKCGFFSSSGLNYNYHNTT